MFADRPPAKDENGGKIAVHGSRARVSIRGKITLNAGLKNEKTSIFLYIKTEKSYFVGSGRF